MKWRATQTRAAAAAAVASQRAACRSTAKGSPIAAGRERNPCQRAAAKNSPMASAWERTAGRCAARDSPMASARERAPKDSPIAPARERNACRRAASWRAPPAARKSSCKATPWQGAAWESAACYQAPTAPGSRRLARERAARPSATVGAAFGSTKARQPAGKRTGKLAGKRMGKLAAKRAQRHGATRGSAQGRRTSAVPAAWDAPAQQSATAVRKSAGRRTAAQDATPA